MIRMRKPELEGLVHLKHQFHSYVKGEIKLTPDESQWVIDALRELRDKAVPYLGDALDFQCMLDALCRQTDMSEEQIATVMRLIVEVVDDGE